MFRLLYFFSVLSDFHQHCHASSNHKHKSVPDGDLAKCIHCGARWRQVTFRRRWIAAKLRLSYLWLGWKQRKTLHLGSRVKYQGETELVINAVWEDSIRITSETGPRMVLKSDIKLITNWREQLLHIKSTYRFKMNSWFSIELNRLDDEPVAALDDLDKAI